MNYVESDIGYKLSNKFSLNLKGKFFEKNICD